MSSPLGHATNLGVRFALVTDIHFGKLAYFEGKLRKLAHEAGPLTRRVVRTLVHDEHPELVVNLGDVLEDESREADERRYREFLAELAPLQVPVLHVAGNHDQVFLTDDDLRRLWGHEGPLYYSRDVAGVHFVVLNTLETKDVCVRLPPAQLAWLAADLAATTLPVVVLMHHPASEMDLTGNRWFEKAPHICRVAERRELRRVLGDSKKVVAVFNGHAHWNHLDVIEGIPYITLQSLTENLDDDAPGLPARSFAVCELSAHRLHVNVHGEQPLALQFER